MLQCLHLVNISLSTKIQRNYKGLKTIVCMHSWGKGVPGSSTDKIPRQCRRLWLHSWVGKIPWRRDRLPTPVFLGFPGCSVGKESGGNVRDLGSITGLGRSPEEGMGKHFSQYSCLENPHGQRTLAGYSPRGSKESDMTERLSIAPVSWT